MLSKVIADLIKSFTDPLLAQITSLSNQVSSLTSDLASTQERLKQDGNVHSQVVRDYTSALSTVSELRAKIDKMEEEYKTASDKIFSEADLYKKEAEALRLQLEEARKFIEEPEVEEVPSEVEATVVKIEKKAKRKR